MPKTAGMGDNFYWGTQDVSADIQSFSRIGGGVTALDFTNITQSAQERKAGLRDGSIDAVCYFDPGTDEAQAHNTFSALPRTDVVCSYFRGTTLGNAAASLVGKQIDYSAQRGADGSLIFSVSCLANGYGLEWGRQLTAGAETLTGASTANIIDFGASEGTTAFGLQAYLHVFAFTGTSATIKLQSSTDNGAGDAYADITGAAFTTVTAAGTERIQTGRTTSVERYVRLNVAGTFSNLNLAVVLVKNTGSVVF